MKIMQIIFAIVLMAIYPFQSSFPQQDDKDKTGSPYFYIKSSGGKNDKLPLKSTDVAIDISGVIADIIVKQTYCNTGKSTLEAVYVFPASTKAAVYGMTMTIGDRKIIAKVMEKQKALKKYEQAKRRGKSASLLEQERPNVFTMNVAHILPGDTILIELKYTELIVPSENLYEFVYPTVVVPRYAGDGDDLSAPASHSGWNANPYLKEGDSSLSQFAISTVLRSGIEVKDVRCTSHKIKTNFISKNEVKCELQNPRLNQGNRDYILQYRLAGDKIESGLLMYEEKDEKFFLAMIEPPKRVLPKMIPPREYIFILDVSGSMSGFPLNITKNLIENLLRSLKSTDLFNILYFAGGSDLYSPMTLRATPKNITAAIQYLNTQRGSGGTELVNALKKALSLKGNNDFSRSFIIATDGYVTVEKQALNVIHENLNTANFFAFGIGKTVNRYCIESMAHACKGEAFVVTNPNDAPGEAARFRKYIDSPVLTNIKLNYKDFEIFDCEPTGNPRDLFAERPLIVFGKWKGSAKGSLTVEGTTGSRRFIKTVHIASAEKSRQNKALKYLWARARLKAISDLRAPINTELKNEIISLGLQYNLLTSYTSFVAVDNKSRTTDMVETTRQPLPLPEGVSNSAVGGRNAMNTYNLIEQAPITRQDFKRPPPPPPLKNAYPPILNIVDDDAEILEEYEVQDVEVDMDTEIEFIEIEEEEAEEPVFCFVEEMPEFPGGNNAFAKLIAAHINYPASARDNGIEGKVYVRFMVGADGSIKNMKIIRGIDAALNKEALRIIKEIAKTYTFKPGKQRGKTVQCWYTVPICFVLE